MNELTEVKEAFKYLDQRQAHLTDFQISFIAGLKKYYTRNKTLTEKQSAVLFEIIKLTKRTLETDRKEETLITT